MKRDYAAILNDLLTRVRIEDYRGYEKFDALNSPALHALSFGNVWLRLFWIQAVKECPFHIRPLLGVRQYRNAKGIALFIRAYLRLYETDRGAAHLCEAKNLADWLLANPSPGRRNLCWGYSFDWQDIPPFYQAKDEPNIVVTCFAGEALLHLHSHVPDRRYLDALQSIARFITHDVPLLSETADERAISYLLRNFDYVVLNVQVMSAALLAKIGKLTNDADLIGIARKQVRYTINRRTSECAWFYTEPRGKSPIRHDNYHTGGILDNLLEFIEASGDHELMEIYRSGLDYYDRNLFESDGAPRWMNNRRYPHDIHGAAQGIISFAKASRYEGRYRSRAERIASWAMRNLYRPVAGNFAYRKGRFLIWNYSLVRWCNGWMARALGEMLGT